MLVLGYVADEDIPHVDTTVAPTLQGPITRARARQLNYQVLSFLGMNPHILEHMMLPNSDMFVTLRNDGPSMDKKDNNDGSKHGEIEDGATTGDSDD
jgi:hypothetical protein